MRTSNPALTSKTFTGLDRTAAPMTLQGTVNKTAFLLLCVVLTAGWTWSQFYSATSPEQGFAQVAPWMMLGVIGALVVAIITAFKKTWAMVTGPLYALLEGLFLGGLSAFFESSYPGIVIQAVALTFGTLICLLLAYSSGLIRASENFKLGVAAATGGIMLIYLASFLLGLFGMRIPYIHENGLIGIGFSLFVVVIAALNLVLDFDFIEQGVARGAPKYMEWYGAFGLIVTLIWLYIEVLRLLAKLRSRD